MKKKLTRIIIFIIIIVISVIHAYGDWKESIYDTSIGSNSYGTVGEMYNNTVVTQEFQGRYNGFSGLSIRTATFDRENHSTLTYVIREKDTDKIVAEGTVDAAGLENNAFHTIAFDAIENSKNRKYILEIQDNDAKSENGITISFTEKGENSEQLLVNGVELEEQALVMKVVTTRFNVEDFIVFLGAILYIVLFIKLLNKFFK